MAHDCLGADCACHEVLYEHKEISLEALQAKWPLLATVHFGPGAEAGTVVGYDRYMDAWWGVIVKVEADTEYQRYDLFYPDDLYAVK